MAYRTATLNDVFQSVGSAISTQSQILSNAADVVADAEYKNNKILLDNFINDKLRSYSESADYDNFEQDFTDSIQQFKDEKLISKSSYGKRLTDEYFKTANFAAMANVKDLVQKGQQNYTYTLHQNSIQELASQPVSQERLTEQLRIVRDDYENGRISASQWSSQSQSLSLQAQTEEALQYYNSVIAANPYASDEQLEKLMDGYTSKLDTGAYSLSGDRIKDENGNDVSYSYSTTEATKAAKDAKWTQIKQNRENNNTKILEQNTKIMNDYYLGNISDAQAIQTVESQIMAIERIANTDLAADQKRSRTTELYTYLNHLKAASNGSAAASGALNYNSLLNELKALKVDLMYAGKNEADISIYNAKDAFEAACKEKFYGYANANINYYEQTGKNPQDDFALYVEPLINSWISDAVKGGYIPDGADTLIENAAKEIKNLTKQGYQDYSGDYTNFIYDSLFGVDYSTAFNGDMNKVTEYINNLTTQYKDNIVAKNIDWRLDPTSKKYQVKDILTMDEGDLKTYVKGQEDSIVFTYGDNTDNVLITGKKAQGIAGKGADMMQRDLYHVIAAAGGDTQNANIITGYQPTEDGYDVTGTLNFSITGTGNKDLDGYTYRYTLDENGKNIVLQKKPSDYSWEKAEKTGQLKTVNRNAYDKEEKALKKAEEDKLKQQQKEAKEAYKAAKANEPAAPDPYEPFRPEGMSDKDWELAKHDLTQLSRYVNAKLGEGK